jgi:hypothetical protein
VRAAPASLSGELYNALVEAGCETELVVYPREGHGGMACVIPMFGGGLGEVRDARPHHDTHSSARTAATRSSSESALIAARPATDEGRRRQPTVIVLEVPVIELSTVSVAVIVWLPRRNRVALKVPVPLVRVLSAGRVATKSLLVKWTVPR